MNPIVYKDFIKTVCLIGSESSGKSTLAKKLAEQYQTSYTEEYGRYFWEEKKGVLAYEDFLKIAEIQISLEEKAKLLAHNYMFADTTPLTTLFYSYSGTQKADPKLIQLSKRTYDYYFLCAPDFPFVQDGTRSNDLFRQQQHAWYLKILAERNISYVLLEGSTQDRIKQINKTLIMRV